MSLLIRRFSFAMFSPFLPIAFPMSPSLTTKMSLSPASTQSTTVVRVRSWNNATYLIVCSSKTISAMRILDGQDVRFPGADHRDGRDGKGHAAGGPKIHVRAAEAEHTDVPEVPSGFHRTIRGEDHELRLLRLRRAKQVMGRDLERGAGEDGRLAAGDAVAADRLHVAVVRHHVGDQHDVADVDREALLLERVVRLVHDCVARGLDPEDLVDLLNRVRAGPRGVDVREFEDLREVRSLRVDDVSIAALPDDRA